jgi:glycine/D-amino acid oxidase-like deaminating enzyme
MHADTTMLTAETSLPARVEHLVIGAGLQGSGIALELARRHRDVLLVEQDARPMNRASLRNEGKIHLGMVYAGDASGRTGQMQLHGALRFGQTLRRWIGARWDAVRLSTPFAYLVARDSLHDSAHLAAQYARLEAAYAEAMAADPDLDYLGARPGRLTEALPLDALAGRLDLDRLSAAFMTCERAVDTDDLALQVSHALLENPRVHLACGAQVVGLQAHGRAWDVTLRLAGTGETRRVRADCVFNAAWDQRIGLDSLVGLAPAPGWVHRLKYRVIARIPAQAAEYPSATMVLGAYGDVVIRNSTAYLSWYPSGMRGWSHDLRPPEDWNDAMRAQVPDAQHVAIGEEIMRQTLAWYPALEGSTPITVDAGAIFAYGVSDVDQPDSGLHDRTRVGVRRVGTFFSVDPGKLTTAPVHAVNAVAQALGSGED